MNYHPSSCPRWLLFQRLINHKVPPSVFLWMFQSHTPLSIPTATSFVQFYIISLGLFYSFLSLCVQSLHCSQSDFSKAQIWTHHSLIPWYSFRIKLNSLAFLTKSSVWYVSCFGFFSCHFPLTLYSDTCNSAPQICATLNWYWVSAHAKLFPLLVFSSYCPHLAHSPILGYLPLFSGPWLISPPSREASLISQVWFRTPTMGL